MTRQEMLNSVEGWPRHKGKGEYLKFLKGEFITQKQAIVAMCFSCSGGEPSGCRIEVCPLHGYYQKYFRNEPSVITSTGADSDLIDAGHTKAGGDLYE